MRLVCPNCGAQYEVPDDVIPQAGRDVQCSNCGNTWFQVHPEQDQDLADELGQPADEDAVYGSDAPETDAEPEPEPDLVPEAAPETELARHDTVPQAEPDVLEADKTDTDGWTAPETPPIWDEPGPGVTAAQMPTPPVEEYEDDYEAWDETPVPPAPPSPVAEQRRRLDPDVADLLREEAEREARQRAADRGGIESQPDLGLTTSAEDEATRRQREAQERMVRLRGGAPVPQTDPEETDGRDEVTAAAASRRDLLPDIDVINSTLRSTSDRKPAAADDHERPSRGAISSQTDMQTQRSGFRRGFLIMVLLMALAICLYVYAPRLAATVPALEAPMDAYVAVMNDMRLWIDAQLRGVLGWLDSMAEEG